MTAISLGDLADPAKYHEPLDLRGQAPELLQHHLRTMWLIRLAEQHLALMRKNGLIGGPVHLATGQEAMAVGVCKWLKVTDKAFGAHRSHSHVLALGSSIHQLFAELLGKETGLSRGLGGSMHLWDGPRGFHGSVPIVAGTVPLAVGAALAAKIRGTTDIGVCFFGDGAVEEGAVHESMNLASVLKAPVLFVAENNLFASHMHIGLRQPVDATARFAAAHNIAFEIVDGNDVVAVQLAAERLIDRTRGGGGPGYLEGVTFRWFGHVDWREDIDVGVRRSVEDLSQWRARDPISRLQKALETADSWSPAQQAAMIADLESEITAAWERAMTDPWPPPSALLDHVYSRRVMP